MKVSIGIPVFNGEKYIRNAVESVLSQSYKDFELIVTDDGSSDGTLDILNSFTDSRLKIVTDGDNRGIAYRLNQQIDLAQGEIFVRMDADDMMMPNRLEKEMEVLKNEPEVDVVGAQAVVIGERDELLGIRGGKRKEIWNDNDYFTSARFIHPTVAGRIEWFRKWRYSNQMSGNEDLDLWIRSHKESVFYDITEPLLFYRDPYKFRLKVFLFRQKRYFRCAWKLRHYMNTPCFFIVCVCRGMASAAMAVLLTILGQEKKMISKRNTALDVVEKEKYKAILNEVKK